MISRISNPRPPPNSTILNLFLIEFVIGSIKFMEGVCMNTTIQVATISPKREDISGEVIKSPYVEKTFWCM